MAFLRVLSVLSLSSSPDAPSTRTKTFLQRTLSFSENRPSFVQSLHADATNGPSRDEFTPPSQNNTPAGAAKNYGSNFFLSTGEYIFSLRDLKYNLFAHVVKERFANLYWDDDLLGVLHGLVHSSSAPP